MLLWFKVFWVISVLELLLWLIPSQKLRRSFASPVIVGLVIVSIGIVYGHPSVPTILLAFMSIYRICNLIRLLSARLHNRYLSRVTVQTSLWIIGLQAGLLLLWQLSNWWQISTYHLWIALAYADLACAVILLMTTIRHLRTTRVPRLHDLAIADRDLPTVTVAIPARDETKDLDDCLQSLLATNYPKLEIVVLDDCSQDKHTPEIIRSFAHDGVVFVQGETPETNWLAKNQAYQHLFEESNGELIVFCGVDVRFNRDSLRQLVAAMLYKHKTMISVIPQNVLQSSSHQDLTFLQPMRYAWELALPRKLFRRPPVLSSCWIIKREVIENAGGFGAVSRSIVPESYFAHASAVHDGYSFMQSDADMGITSNKSVNEQRATTVRIRYPQLHRRMELALIVTIFEIGSVMMPLAVIVAALLGHISLQLTIVSSLTTIALVIGYSAVVRLTYRRWLFRSIFLLPIAVVIDVILLNYSMIRYEFFTVFWKGRNICVPVMYVMEESTEDA
jgi:glycosyltransferase involved in cell wall biosynthesis